MTETITATEAAALLGVASGPVARRTLDRWDRPTHNTLLRIAVDLLLARADELHGDDEAALRASVGLPEHPH